jgi:hypothetical protein
MIATNDPRARDFDQLRYWLPLKCVYTKALDPNCDPEVREEQWIPNLQVAPLLATNDLQLSQCVYSEEPAPLSLVYAFAFRDKSPWTNSAADPSWEKRETTPFHRVKLWNHLMHIMCQNEVRNPRYLTQADVDARRFDARDKFAALEHIFWVKVSACI